MKALTQSLVLLLASIALASCGGGGGGSNSAFTPPSVNISVSAESNSITTNSFTTLTVSITNQNGSAVANGTSVSASVSPATIGSLSGSGNGSGATATNTTSGGTTSFLFNSSSNTGTAHIVVSTTVGSATDSAAIDITVKAGNSQDPRLQLDASTTTLPINPLPYDPANSVCPATFLGSPYVSEVTVTWRHSNGQLVAGTSTVNVSVAPTTVMGFSTLDTSGSSNTNPCLDQFHTLLGSGPVNVTGGVGTIYITSGSVPGVGTLSVVAIDPDNGQTITSQLAITVAGGASSLPTSISAIAESGAYVSNSGYSSAPVAATVTDGNGAVVPNPDGYDNVQFQIIGGAVTDGKLSGIDASGTSHTGTTINTVTHNGIASVAFLAGTQQGTVQVKATTDRADGNVDNGMQDPVSATATVVVSDGKLYSLTIVSPDTGAITTSGVSSNATEDPTGSGNYDLTVSAKGVDRQGNPVLPGTTLNFGAVDSPQAPSASTGPSGWFQISGTHGNPQEGGKLFTATDGKFTTAGGGAGPGDTLLVIGKQSEGAPAGNDDLESSSRITNINSATSLDVSTQFNLNDTTGVSVDNGSVLPYIIGRATFSSVVTPAYTDSTSASATLTGVATTTLNFPASAIGKAVAVWAQGTGTNEESSPGRTTVVSDVATLVFPGSASGATMTASPDPIQGNTSQSETVCYFDGNNQPIPNFDISFAFSFSGTGSGTADGVNNAGKFQHLTGSNGCVTVNVITASLAVGDSDSITFSAGPNNAGSNGASVTVPIVVNAAQLQVSCPAGTGGVYSVSLTLLSSSGSGISGESITGSCTSSDSSLAITQQPAPTNAAGSTTAIISDPNSVGGTCTFASSSYANLVATVTIQANGTSSCSGGFSPPAN